MEDNKRYEYNFLLNSLNELMENFDKSLTPTQRNYLAQIGYKEYRRDSIKRMSSAMDTNETPAENTEPQNVNAVSSADSDHSTVTLETEDITETNEKQTDPVGSLKSITQTNRFNFFSQTITSQDDHETKKRRYSLPDELSLKPLSPSKIAILTKAVPSTSLKDVTITSSVKQEENTNDQPKPVFSPMKPEKPDDASTPIKQEITASTNLFQTPVASSIPIDGSSLPPSPPISELPSSGKLARQAQEERCRQMSAGRRNRYLRNLDMLENSDSSREEDFGSVAHVDYFCNEGKGEATEEKEGSLIQPTMEYMMRNMEESTLIRQDDAIPYIEDSLEF